MKCPTCGHTLELYAPGRVDFEVVECSPDLPDELRSEIARLFSAGRECTFKCCGPLEHLWQPSHFPEQERRELERQNLASIEASKRNREHFRAHGRYPER